MNYPAMKTNQIVNMMDWWAVTVIMVIVELGLQIIVCILYVGKVSLYKKHLFNLYIILSLSDILF